MRCEAACRSLWQAIYGESKPPALPVVIYWFSQENPCFEFTERLSQSPSTDMGIYLKYYICDILFTAAFLNFMIQMVSGFKGSVFKRIKNVSYVFAVIRGLFDMTENCMMLNQIYSFPDVNLELIDICNIITRL